MSDAIINEILTEIREIYGSVDGPGNPFQRGQLGVCETILAILRKRNIKKIEVLNKNETTNANH